jgi:hypothetical protein
MILLGRGNQQPCAEGGDLSSHVLRVVTYLLGRGNQQPCAEGGEACSSQTEWAVVTTHSY